MKTHILAFLLLFPFFAQSEKNKNIHSSFYDKETKTRIIKYDDGSVEFIEGASSSLKFLEPVLSQPENPYVIEIDNATVIGNYTSATNLLRRFKTSKRDDSQCYDRAHVWTYNARVRENITLNKVFLFFADHYIAKYKFKWWFHVAPYAEVEMNGVVTERVMDPVFYKYPLKFKLWTDIFMKNKATCKEITQYSQYLMNVNTNDCFIIKTTMFFWQPRDIEEFESTGVAKNTFIDWEIRWAFENAFYK